MDMELSVIIPFFNSEKYLRKCIESLIKQQIERCEFIFIDDGSEDLGHKIIEEYQKNDSRISYIKVKNSGVSNCRNLGITLAKGKYITFLDSDDWIEENTYIELIHEMKSKDCDMAMCGLVKEFEDYQEIERLEIPNDKVIFNLIEYPQYFIKIAGSACKCMYLKEILLQKKIFFPIDIKLSEDRLFNMMYINEIKKFIFLDKPLYHYRQSNTSTVGKYKKNMIKEIIKSRNVEKEILQELASGNNVYKEMYDINFCMEVFQCLNNEFKNKELDRFNMYKRLKEIMNVEEVKVVIRDINFKEIKNTKKKLKLYIIRYRLIFIYYILFKRKYNESM